MGQVWTKTSFDGTDEAGFHGGRGSVLAVTANSIGPDRVWGSLDDVTAPLNFQPMDVSIDWDPAIDNDPNDRVRGFYSLHAARGANFAFADGSVHFINESMFYETYRHMSTMNGGEYAPVDR